MPHPAARGVAAALAARTIKNKPKGPIASKMRSQMAPSWLIAIVLLQVAAVVAGTALSTSSNSQPQQAKVSAGTEQQVAGGQQQQQPPSPPPPAQTVASDSRAEHQAAPQADGGANCPVVCSNAEYLSILNKISTNTEIIRDFQRSETGAASNATSRRQQIRPECVRQLIQMIKNLASGELEMKTLLEFASSSSRINLRSDLSYLRASYASDRDRDLERRRQLHQLQSAGCQRRAGAGGQQPITAAESSAKDYYLLGDEPSAQGAADVDKSHFLPKLVASVDQWLDTIERFTLTREWGALMRVFNGVESILSMFSNSTTTSASATSAATATGSSESMAGKLSNQLAIIQKTAAPSSELLQTLERDLPGQVQMLTGSLNQLFPWHVWPWNNIDLFSTIDTFLNHGIFAFSKTTAGPERRIDYLPQMLETLFKSLKYDSFPKRCNDWSRLICDPELFYDRLALAPPVGSLDSNEQSTHSSVDELAKRAKLVKELVGDNKNKLTQELVCIMFSSLSMQQFGANDAELPKPAVREPQHFEAPGGLPTAGAPNQLAWSGQIRKGLKLYKLSREALTDDQWAALYKQFNDLWNQMKMSDRVIMVGRIVQLLTNCHMPREILESALWKDIYKYKNALNQISDIVIEELNRSSETGKFTIEQLAIGSKHLEEILTRFIKLLPRLIESLSLTITNQLPELVGKFFDEKIAFFKGPCKGHSFSELVPSLAKYRVEIVELERLVCQQLQIKPSITMSQINNLTNEFLAMAFNFTNFGGSFQNLPRFWAGPGAGPAAVAGGSEAAKAQVLPPSQTAAAAAATGAAIVAATRQNLNILMNQGNQQGGPAAPQAARHAVDSFEPEQPARQNGTSIVDELAANPRLAQIVAILQSSALDPPEVHAELPELDWVEAGTSVALFYETIQKLMSYEGLFVVFPEVGQFQDEMRERVESSKRMFTKFGKKAPANLAAYSLDTAMPVALRTFQPLDSLHSECLSTFRDLFGETEFVDATLAASAPVASAGSTGSQPQQQPAAAVQLAIKESRKWQCAVSATNFASFALNNLIRTFNSMLKNILNQMSRQRDLYKFKQAPAATASTNSTGSTGSQNATCVLFDGSITTLMDNLPQMVDLCLETALIASTTTNQRLTLKETLCSFENTLDPLGEPQHLQKQFKLREAICHLLHESSLSTCASTLKVDQWTSTMKELNSTWFEMSAISVEPSFRGILGGVHEFLELFGKVKPSSMSDGLIARVLNFNSYWTGLMNKAVSSIEKYRERRFQLSLQILMPIIYDNLPVYADNTNSTIEETKMALKTSILSARAILSYLTRSEADQLSNATAPGNNGNRATSGSQLLQDQLDQQLRWLSEWTDRHSLAFGETLIRTGAQNLTKFERLLNSTDGSANSANEIWNRFCKAPVDTYLEFETAAAANKAAVAPSESRLAELAAAKEAICSFEWSLMRERLFQQANLLSAVSAPNATSATQNGPATPLDQYSTRQLIRVALTKWGQVLDLVSASIEGSSTRKASRLPKSFSLAHWKPLQERLPQLTPSQYDPTNFIWIWRALERLVNTIDQANRHQYSPQGLNSTALAPATLVTQQPVAASPTAEALSRIFDQLNCALDAVKGGITWDNMVNIYQDRHDVLAAHSTLNNGIALASASANTFLAHKKFQKFLNSFVKPRLGLSAFCDMRDRARLEAIFALSPAGDEELASALESFQELICDTNLESFVQNINPISICYQQQSGAGSNSSALAGAAATTATPAQQQSPPPLADTVDRFFKLASLAALDAKLVDTNNAKPPIFDKSQWEQLRLWWLNQTEAHQGNSGLALALVRVFQTLDSVNSEHVVWRAIFRSVHELSEVSAYLVRAAEMERQANLEQREKGQPTKLALIREAAEQVDSAMKESNQKAANATGLKFGHKQQQLASTLANVMFPEVSNFISLKTFKQLRYIKSISDYFANAPGAQESLCRNLTAREPTRRPSNSSSSSSASDVEDGDVFDNDKQPRGSKFELLDYKLNSSKRLYSLLCHYNSSQWLTAMNIVLSSKTSSLSKKVNYMTKYLLIFTKNFQHNENLQSFIHGQQLENIEAVANTSVSYLIALTQPFRTLTLSKISNISWHSIPTLLDSIDRHLCASKNEQLQKQTGGSNQQQAYQLAVYEPKKPDIETLICKLPSWNITQVYRYISENIDLQNMISLATQNNHTATLFGLSATGDFSEAGSHQKAPTNSSTARGQATRQPAKTCITPFKFASKWLKIIQGLIDESMSKSSRDKIRKCLNSSKRNQSFYLQAMRYVKLLNSFLSTINDLTINNSWPVVRRTWNSISYAILNQSGQTAPLGIAAPQPAVLPLPAPQPAAPIF